MSLREELLAGRRFQKSQESPKPNSLQEAANGIIQAEILPLFSNLYEQWRLHSHLFHCLLVDVNFSKEGSYTIRVSPCLGSEREQKKVVFYQNNAFDKGALWREVERIAKNEWNLETGSAQGIGEYFLMPLC